jgi:hypothetical protein
MEIISSEVNNLTIMTVKWFNHFSFFILRKNHMPFHFHYSANYTEGF